MRIVIAPDSFKGSLSAREVAEEIARGWGLAQPDATFALVPLADGGEGTVRSLVDATNGSFVEAEVTGPYGASTIATYGLLGDIGRYAGGAVIEMAAASGLHLRTDPSSMDPRNASSIGTGQLIKHALQQGVRSIVLGLGGSATNDGGAGMLTALGVRLLDGNGVDLPPGPIGLQKLDSVDVSGLHPAVADCDIQIASDVSNPLCGPTGAAAVFGPQKGVDPADIEQHDRALERFAAVVRTAGLGDYASEPGAGAAGGLGFAALSFLGARMRPGIELVMETVGFEEALTGADLVITGEGRIDRQTLAGKVPFGAMRAARRQGIPTIAIVGSMGPGANEVIDAGLSAIFSIVNAPMSLAEALESTATNLQETARSVAGLWTTASSGQGELPKP